jgi:hypothetical protein
MKAFRCPFAFAMVLTFAPFSVTPALADGGVNYCVTRDRVSNQIADFLENSCGKAVNVAWYDEGYCDTGCASTVAAHGKQSVTKAKGRVRMGVCEAPKYVRTDKWKGDGPFACE